MTYLNGARADELARTSLIEERDAVEVIVCRTDTDDEDVERARDAFAAADFDTFRDQVDSLRDRQVSIPVYPGDDAVNVFRGIPQLIGNSDDIGIRVLDSDQFAPFFDASCGVVIPESTVESRFL